MADIINLSQLPQNLIITAKTPIPILISSCIAAIFDATHIIRLYYSNWKHYVKTGGTWDFKNSFDPFKSGARSDMSPFFWYNGYHGKQYKLFPYHKPGLLRFDDPGNMCYGATGKIVMSKFDSIVEKFILRVAAELVAFDKSTWKEFWNPMYTELEKLPPIKWFDDPWDLTAIEWAYDTPFVQSDEFVPFKTFEFYCKRFNLAPNN